jgi:nucleotide-binding universal stress UspA family protein
MRKILIPIDFSENAFNAIKYALELFKYERSEFVIMHAFANEVYEHTLEMPQSLFELYKEKVREQSDKKLQKVVAEMLTVSPNPKHEYGYMSVFGNLVHEANVIVDKQNIDVLVMGTKGKSNDRDVLFGSNTLQVIKYVTCPVLAIPSKYQDVHPQNILFSTAYQLPYKKRELKLLSTIAERFAATIKVMQVSKFKELSHRQRDNQDLIKCSIRENKTEFLNLEGEDVTLIINDFIQKNNVDILVMVNSRRPYFENVLHTSTIEKIGWQIQIPFLVLQNLARD